MSKKHDGLVIAAKTAINEVHGDTSVDQQHTLDSLRDIREHIDTQIEALEDDLENDDDDDPDIDDEDDVDNEIDFDDGDSDAE